MTILIAIRDDWTADMLEYDAAPEEAACLMPDEIGGDHIRAIYDITDGTPAEVSFILFFEFLYRNVNPLYIPIF